MSATVRIDSQTYSLLSELADNANSKMADIVAEAVDELYRRRFIDDCNRAYARLKRNSKVWQEELRERREWDRTLGDGTADL